MTVELKKFKTIEEQINLLKSRGLIIDDEEQAYNTLEKINYYRFTGYLHTYKKDDTNNYLEGITFTQISRIYDFDVKLTRLLLYVLEDIEETFKTRLAYSLSSAYPEDPLIYLDKDIYKKIDKFEKFIKLFNDSKKKNSELPFIKHHNNKYDGQLPIWVAVEIMTMGNIHALYSNLLNPYEKDIAKKYNTGLVQLENWLENLTYTRNHLAHFMRIYRYSFGRIPKSCVNHKIDTKFNGRIFDQICIMSFMYSKPEDWNKYVIKEMQELINDYSDVVKLSDIGFPNNWKEVLLVK